MENFDEHNRGSSLSAVTRAGQAQDSSGLGAGRQGVLVEGEPRLPGQARDKGGNPGQGRPGPTVVAERALLAVGRRTSTRSATGTATPWNGTVNKLRGCRATATRYEKRNYMYLGTIAVTSIWIWLRNPTAPTLSDTWYAQVASPSHQTCRAKPGQSQSRSRPPLSQRCGNTACRRRSSAENQSPVEAYAAPAHCSPRHRPLTRSSDSAPFARLPQAHFVPSLA